MPIPLLTRTVTILDGESDSDFISLKGNALVGIRPDAAFDGTGFTITTVYDVDDNATSVYNAETGSQVTLQAAAGNYYAVDPTIFYGLTKIQLSSNAPQSGADSVIILFLRAV